MPGRRNPYAPPTATDSPTNSDSPASAEPSGPRGLGGWLIVMLLGLVLWTTVYGIGLYNLVMHLDA